MNKKEYYGVEITNLEVDESEDNNDEM